MCKFALTKSKTNQLKSFTPFDISYGNVKGGGNKYTTVLDNDINVDQKWFAHSLNEQNAKQRCTYAMKNCYVDSDEEDDMEEEEDDMEEEEEEEEEVVRRRNPKRAATSKFKK